MRTGWVQQIGDFRVERPGGVLRTGASVDLSRPPICVIHTTQCPWDVAIRAFRTKLSTPTFQVGPRRIAQFIPLGEMAGALQNLSGGVETNRWARVQIEVVFTVVDPTHRRPFLFDDAILAPLVALMRMLREDCGIPFERPFPPDPVMEGRLATFDFARRHSGKWGREAGYFGHLEAPENDHWDPGNLDYAKLFERASELQHISRTLRLLTPLMKGPDVENAQRLLTRNRFANFAPGPVTGVFNLVTAQAAARAKWALGYPTDLCVGIYGQKLENFLTGRRRLPPDHRARRLARVGLRPPVFNPEHDPHPH